MWGHLKSVLAVRSSLSHLVLLNEKECVISIGDAATPMMRPWTLKCGIAQDGRTSILESLCAYGALIFSHHCVLPREWRLKEEKETGASKPAYPRGPAFYRPLQHSHI